MSNHPNRGNRANNAASNPYPSEITAARMASGLTVAECANLVYASAVKWQKWESGDDRMHPACFELFNIKTKG